MRPLSVVVGLVFIVVGLTAAITAEVTGGWWWIGAAGAALVGIAGLFSALRSDDVT